MTQARAGSLGRYNTNAAAGQDPDFHKHPDFLAAQDIGPWGAFFGRGAGRHAAFTAAAY